MSVLCASHTITTAVQIGVAFLSFFPTSLWNVSDCAFVNPEFKEHDNG